MSMDKYSFKSHHSYSPNERLQDVDADPYSPVIVEDLLSGINEWRNIQDIIRMTFKALTEVVKAQGETLRELERQMPTRASKAELNSGLALKSNVTDVSKTISDVVSSLEGKLAAEDLQLILRDYVLRSDFQYLMSNKAGIEEVRTLLDTRVSTHEFKGEVNAIHSRLEDLSKDSIKKMGNYVSVREFQALQASVDQKVSLNEFNEQLETKANKNSIANALHRKANKSDVDAILVRKAEQSDIQTLLNALEGKADLHTVDKIGALLDLKVDRSDFTILGSSLSSKADRADFEFLSSSLSNLKLDTEHKIGEYERKFDNIKIDFDGIRQSLTSNLTKKADAKDLERVIQLVSKKADLDYISASLSKANNDLNDEVNSIRDELTIQRRTLEDAVSDKLAKTENFYDKLSAEIYKLNDQLKNILEERRNDIEETAKFVKNITGATKKELQMTQDRTLNDIEELKKTVEDLITRKVEKKDFLEYKAKVNSELDAKVDITEVQSALNTCQSDISARFMDYKEEVKNLIRNHEQEIFSLLSKKANSSDLSSGLTSKVDANVLHQLLGQKVGFNDLEDIRRKLELINRAFDERTNIKEIEGEISHQRRNIDDLQKELLLKANIKDVCTLLDTKSNIDDVNKALVEVHKELDLKGNQEDLQNIVNDQALINESLCTENIVGRWAWKSGDLKSGSTVPWELQLSNTLPDNFLWEKDKSSILTVAPGLYEISFGFFAKKKPAVQVLVNGEAILSAVNSGSYVIHHSSGKMKDVSMNKHSSGNVTGLTMVDFIILPARARVSLAYTGETGAEGFLGLKRL